MVALNGRRFDTLKTMTQAELCECIHSSRLQQLANNAVGLAQAALDDDAAILLGKSHRDRTSGDSSADYKNVRGF
ncbi:uncharacterized protein CTHT_0018970 [Thermochaetoides thermophila DSM 1495]|uniref:Uncharacterized protein n=1 Tax=Chaetomium thermophilum (strain DSM 1495 / CBS 144.50 / IMI 039719) TaxID=759272 RepID=G0S2Y8_CHATD|nr:hypothetical protein CTHT_0018970 [Thermochaetoides thermophila DSM 1495]EGS22371.1 hypothetical protein CTHT_0018970 [Thermochaetoides thermophila DSM 1495]